jgi:hypothetical protein
MILMAEILSLFGSSARCVDRFDILSWWRNDSKVPNREIGRAGVRRPERRVFER